MLQIVVIILKKTSKLAFYRQMDFLLIAIRDEAISIVVSSRNRPKHRFVSIMEKAFLVMDSIFQKDIRVANGDKFAKKMDELRITHIAESRYWVLTVWTLLLRF